jgi:hypothetical protein
MTIVTPQWPYFVKVDDTLALREPDSGGQGSEVGEYFGEWGAELDADGRPVGVRLMCVSEDKAREAALLEITNCCRIETDWAVHLFDQRIPSVALMPYLPVYIGYLTGGEMVLQCSGLE